MRIYISASWKQRQVVRDVAVRLRSEGHEVYDFTDPACRKVPELPPERFNRMFDPAEGGYPAYLNSFPEFKAAMAENRAALDWCDAVLLILPCGLDATADWAYAVGKGKFTVVAGAPKKGERHPTHLWADARDSTVEEGVRTILVVAPYMHRLRESIRTGADSHPPERRRNTYWRWLASQAKLLFSGRGEKY